jgi:predicted nucleic acid-binding protein
VKSPPLRPGVVTHRQTWAALFDRGDAVGATEKDVRTALTERRARRREDGAEGNEGADERPDPPAPSPARVVADADVLAADLLVGGASRDALDALRRHSWTALVASDHLLDDAEAVVAAVADDALAADWRRRTEAWRERVPHPAGDNPALASAYRGGAMHLLSFDERLRSVRAGATLRGRHVPLSVRPPDAFATVFDAASLYRETVGGDYPGPDRDPRD